MNNKPQRLRITEKGWRNYNGHFGGIEFKDSLSVEMVDPTIAARLGSLIRLEAVDTGEQTGYAAELQRTHEDRAAVVPERPRGETTPSAHLAPEANAVPKHSRESLEAVADAHGIAGLRAIAEPMGVKGRGISELIEEILKAQIV